SRSDPRVEPRVGLRRRCHRPRPALARPTAALPMLQGPPPRGRRWLAPCGARKSPRRFHRMPSNPFVGSSRFLPPFIAEDLVFRAPNLLAGLSYDSPTLPFTCGGGSDRRERRRRQVKRLVRRAHAQAPDDVGAALSRFTARLYSSGASLT